MSMHLLIVRRGFALLILALFIGCARESENVSYPRFESYALKRVVPNDSPLQALPATGNWTLMYAIGIGSDGYESMRIANTGDTIAVRRLPDGTWRKYLFTVPAPIVAELREVLDRSGYWALAREYHADIADGTTVSVNVQVGEIEKHVYCNNHFPEAVRQVDAYVWEKIIPLAQDSTSSEASHEEFFPPMSLSQLLPVPAAPA